MPLLPIPQPAPWRLRPWANAENFKQLNKSLLSTYYESSPWKHWRYNFELMNGALHIKKKEKTCKVVHFFSQDTEVYPTKVTCCPGLRGFSARLISFPFMTAFWTAFIPPAFEWKAKQVHYHLHATNDCSLGVASKSDVKKVSEIPTGHPVLCRGEDSEVAPANG